MYLYKSIPAFPQQHTQFGSNFGYYTVQETMLSAQTDS